MHTLEIIGYFITTITGWLGGALMKRNAAIHSLMATIDKLTKQNEECHAVIISLQDEIVEVRRENADLKEGQAKMTREIKLLQNENEELKNLITKNSQWR